jgi:branched-chain amino acid transport system substrate-binding protein
VATTDDHAAPGAQGTAAGSLRPAPPAPDSSVPGDGGGRGGSAAVHPGRAGEVTDAAVTSAGGDGFPAATAAPPGAVPPPPRSLPEILLGSFGTASGLIGRETAPIVVAVRAWSADVNTRGGLAGHPLRVVFGDDGGDPNRALAIAKHMVEQDKVAAFVGTSLTITIGAVIPYLEQVRVPVIGGPGGSPIEDRSPVVFNPQTGAGEAQGHAVHLAVVSQTDRRKMAVLYCTESAACANVANYAKQFAARYGVSVVYEARVSIAQPDFTAEMLAARKAGADVVVTLVDSYGIVRAVRSAHRQNYYPVFSATVAVNTESLTATGTSDEIEGILGFAATVPYRTSPKLAAYVEAVARFVPGGALGGYGATAWVQGMLVERVAREFRGTTRPRNTDFLAALHSLRNESLGGVVPPLTFEDGPGRKVNRCGVPIKISGGKITAPLGDTFICAQGP